MDSGYYSPYILDVMYGSVRYSGYCWYWEYCGTLVLWCPKSILRVLGVSPVLKAQILRVLGRWWAAYRTPSTVAKKRYQAVGFPCNRMLKLSSNRGIRIDIPVAFCLVVFWGSLRDNTSSKDWTYRARGQWYWRSPSLEVLLSRSSGRGYNFLEIFGTLLEEFGGGIWPLL